MRLLLRNLAKSGASHSQSCEYDGVRQSPRCNRKAHCSSSICVSVGVSEHVIVIVGTVGIFVGKLCGTSLVKLLGPFPPKFSSQCDLEEEDSDGDADADDCRSGEDFRGVDGSWDGILKVSSGPGTGI
jgi:hypothetical protein